MTERTSRTALTIRGDRIAWLDELAPYSYAIPEAKNPPEVFTRFVSGQEVDPRDLYAALDKEGRAAVIDDPEAVSIVEVLLARLDAAFPPDALR